MSWAVTQCILGDRGAVRARGEGGRGGQGRPHVRGPRGPHMHLRLHVPLRTVYTTILSTYCLLNLLRDSTILVYSRPGYGLV